MNIDVARRIYFTFGFSCMLIFAGLLIASAFKPKALEGCPCGTTSSPCSASCSASGSPRCTAR